jgi:hypothetical protein
LSAIRVWATKCIFPKLSYLNGAYACHILCLHIFVWEMLGILIFLPMDGYQDDVKLIHWKWLKQLGETSQKSIKL